VKQQGRPVLGGAAAVTLLLTVSGCALGGGSGDAGAELPRRPTVTVSPESTGPAKPTGAWPDSEDTGARGELERRPGTTVTRDGTLLENIWFDGQLTIAADDVVLRNVYVVSDSYYGVLVTGRKLLIEDSTLRGGSDSTAALAASKGGSFVASRIDASGAEDGVRLGDGCTLRDSYVHNLRGGEDRHNDGVTADGYDGWSISGNTILNRFGQTAAVWVGDSRFGASSGLLAGNLLAGGGFVVYAGSGHDAGIRVRDNAFSTRFWPAAGQWGLVYDWDARDNVWSGNVWADGPHRGRSAGP
jgi:hypothetical protein